MKPLLSVIVTLGVLSLACGAPPLECDDDEEEVDGECVKEDDPFGDFGDADTDADTDADSDTDADTDADPPDMELNVYYEAFGEGIIRWNAAASGGTYALTLYVIDTGDDAFEAGCTPETFGGLACGVWTEQHNAWFVTDDKNELGGTSNALTLEDAGIPEEQITNATTLFTVDYMATGNATWMVYAEGPDGFGCMTGGDDRSFFVDYCTN